MFNELASFKFIIVVKFFLLFCFPPQLKRFCLTTYSLKCKITSWAILSLSFYPCTVIFNFPKAQLIRDFFFIPDDGPLLCCVDLRSMPISNTIPSLRHSFPVTSPMIISTLIPRALHHRGPLVTGSWRRLRAPRCLVIAQCRAVRFYPQLSLHGHCGELARSVSLSLSLLFLLFLMRGLCLQTRL